MHLLHPTRFSINKMEVGGWASSGTPVECDQIHSYMERMKTIVISCWNRMFETPDSLGSGFESLAGGR